VKLRTEIARILDGLQLGTDGVYSSALPLVTDQADEIRERLAVARGEHPDLLREVGRHHSIPVMESEVRRLLRGVRADGVVVDVGSGWGWHWSGLAGTRPDITVVVVDFVRENLQLAARMLGGLVNHQVFLVHGDATSLPFPSDVFDGYWSVQAFQHIPRFEQAVVEAHRVLRPAGNFASYSLNRARAIEAVYGLLGKRYHVEGKRPGSFYLARGSAGQAALVSRVFGAPVVNRYTEILFHPDFKLYTGAASSRVGAFDGHLGSATPSLAWIARQRSFHTSKVL
jgi:SAM-dependent methyltransferase